MRPQDPASGREATGQKGGPTEFISGAAERPGGAGEDRGAGVPLEDVPPPDRGLARLLQEWNAPALPDSLDRRVLEAFRARRARRPLWRRFFAASIRVPLPVALAALLLLGLALWMPRRESPRRETAEPAEAPVNARLDSKPVVTRTNLAGFEPVREMNVTVLPQGIAP